MCASYKIRTKKHVIEGLGISVPETFGEDGLDILARGYGKTERAPVMVFEDGRRVLKEMCFSLCPRWSGEFPFKASTYNARMNRSKTDRRTGKPLIHPKTGQPLTEYIFEMPTWKASFRDRHCLVPMSWAMESSYFGTHAGNMVRFSRQDEALFLAVGIWDRWVHRGTGESVDSFAILTDDPYEFFYNTGHDRSLFVISEDRWNIWLGGRFAPQDTYAFLRESRVDFHWKAEIERPLKKGWEKRAPSDAAIKAIGETVWGKGERRIG
uniref:SOS response associated peptidase (SRAP) n=1 Tax=Candidatus Kentrum sp. TC TaxID=2126339 RepID=A0A450ZB57_9GAMM|nr:MAG: SOS response associated peptidase (SRAP) [Candidatus Kentron sp. TC]VFK51013.1 MAG: SOS response associated peptidase (SRAP) [Candidatus Kentron sp. TC]